MNFKFILIIIIIKVLKKRILHIYMWIFATTTKLDVLDHWWIYPVHVFFPTTYFRHFSNFDVLIAFWNIRKPWLTSVLSAEQFTWFSENSIQVSIWKFLYLNCGEWYEDMIDMKILQWLRNCVDGSYLQSTQCKKLRRCLTCTR